MFFQAPEPPAILLRDEPVRATIDYAKVRTNIQNAANQDGVFQATLDSTIFNLFLYQNEFKLRSLTANYYFNLKVGFETVPQLDGTYAAGVPKSSNAISNSERIFGSIQGGLAIGTRYSKSIKDSGPFFEYRLFDYRKSDPKSEVRPRAYKLGWGYQVPLGKDVIELEIAGEHDPNYTDQPTRTYGRARYNYFMVEEGSCAFFEFAYNRPMKTGLGPINLSYTLGLRMDVRKLVEGIIGIKPSK